MRRRRSAAAPNAAATSCWAQRRAGARWGAGERALRCCARRQPARGGRGPAAARWSALHTHAGAARPCASCLLAPSWPRTQLHGVYEGSYWQLLADVDELAAMLEAMAKGPPLLPEPPLLLPPAPTQARRVPRPLAGVQAAGRAGGCLARRRRRRLLPP